MERFGWIFTPGDKVMQIETDYGDIGYIDRVNPDDGELTASFDGRTVVYGFGELDGLRRDHPQKPGLGISRRSNPDHNAAHTMLQRNLL